MSRPESGKREGAIPFQILQNEFFRLIDGYMKSSSRGSGEPEPAEPWVPPLDVYETADETLVLVELPGVDPNRVEIAVTGNALTVRGTKTPDQALEPFLRVRDRRFGGFAVEAPLSSPVDFEAARAEARDGVLTIHLPKRKAEEPRVIPVRTA